MISAEIYLQRVEDLLLRTGGIVESSLLRIDPLGDDSIGTLRVALRYRRGHRLRVTMTIDATAGYPDWIIYSFHLLDSNDRCIFRYDNAPHYPLMATFPHHKHSGPAERPEPHHLPTLHDLVQEIIDIVSE